MVVALTITGIFAVICLAVWLVRRGHRLQLLRALATLPASSFPERADIYICDKCARDVTKQFRLRQSHGWAPMGPTGFVCRCGQRYLTGAIEWDHLGLPEKHRRVWQTFVLRIFLSRIFSIFFVLVDFALRFLFGLREAGFRVAVFITAVPLVWLQTTFWLEVLASIWRTRLGRSAQQT